METEKELWEHILGKEIKWTCPECETTYVYYLKPNIYSVECACTKCHIKASIIYTEKVKDLHTLADVNLLSSKIDEEIIKKLRARYI